MADTIPGIRWALERVCAVRGGPNFHLPDIANKQVAGLKTLSDARENQRFVNGYAVTSYTTENDDSGATFMLPCSVHPLQKLISGDVAAVDAMCQGCEAHLTKERSKTLAGCCDFLGDIHDPFSEDLETALQETLSSTGLRTKWEQHFVPTKPVWFSFWIGSPLTRAQCEIMLALFEYVFKDDLDEMKDMSHFMAALRASLAWELRLHVEMSPLGHTDFGWYTVFPHCPRCRATADVPRWEKAYKSQQLRCAVCGHTFDPSKTHKEEKFDHETSNEIENICSPAESDAFKRAFLAHQGATEEQVQQVLDNENLVVLQRNIYRARLRVSNLAHLYPPVSRKELPPVLVLELPGSVPLELLRIPAGKYRMTCTQGEEFPPTLIQFDHPFYLGKFQLTQRQWLAVMGANPSKHKGSLDLPLDRVSWLEALVFCERAAELTKRPLRLPSEAEWEYACRAGTTSAFAFGEELLPEHANFNVDIMDFDARTVPTPVGQYPPNAWGLCDMHGNVEEWCDDEFSSKRDRSTAFRVLRGGSCRHAASACRSDSRAQYRADAGGYDPNDEANAVSDDPLLQILDSLKFPMGFRVALSTA